MNMVILNVTPNAAIIVCRRRAMSKDFDKLKINRLFMVQVL